MLALRTNRPPAGGIRHHVTWHQVSTEEELKKRSVDEGAST